MTELFLEPNEPEAPATPNTPDPEDGEPTQLLVTPAEQLFLTTEVTRMLIDLTESQMNMIAKQTAHTNAVNQFGIMLDSIVKNVAGIGQAIQRDGLSGLMKMMGSKSE